MKPYRRSKPTSKEKVKIFLPATGIIMVVSSLILGVAGGIILRAKDAYTEKPTTIVVETSEEKKTRQIAKIEDAFYELLSIVEDQEQKSKLLQLVSMLEGMVEDEDFRDDLLDTILDLSSQFELLDSIISTLNSNSTQEEMIEKLNLLK